MTWRKHITYKLRIAYKAYFLDDKRLNILLLLSNTLFLLNLEIILSELFVNLILGQSSRYCFKSLELIILLESSCTCSTLWTRVSFGSSWTGSSTSSTSSNFSFLSLSLSTYKIRISCIFSIWVIVILRFIMSFVHND